MIFVNILIWLVYLFLSVSTIILLKHINIRRFGFSEGVLIGLIYFLAIPMFIILWNGKLEADGIFANPYFPFDDLNTTLNIFIGWFVVIFATIFLRAMGRRDSDYYNSFISVYYFKLMLVLYFVFSVYSTLSSGIGSEGSHWHTSTAAAFEGSSSYIFIKNFSGAYRVMLFGGLLGLFITKKLDLKKVLLLGAGIALFDLMTTFNRILLVFYVILMLLVIGRYRKWMYLVIISLFPIVAFLSNAWPNFRSTAFVNGLSWNSISDAWQVSLNSINDSGLHISDMMNGLFESSNIVVYNFIVNKFGEEFPFYYGYTFLLRPLTTFIPSTIWVDKPRVFGTYLGEIINSYPGLALNSTLFGEVYANFYLFWPIFLFAFIVFFDRLYNYLDRYIPFSNYMAFFIAIALWRFDANFASVCIYSLLLLILIKIFYFNLKKTKW